jgi:protein-tyrosine phosphatase
MANSSPYRITTICLGNICRSPMAEVVLRDRVQQAGLADLVQVDSAGTGDWHIGYPADERASATLDAFDYARGNHTARQIQEDWVADIDLALVMDTANFQDVSAIVMRSGSTTDLRMFRSFDPSLAHLAPPHPELDVPDPYYGGDDGFIAVLQMIERASDGVIAHVQEHISRSS